MSVGDVVELLGALLLVAAVAWAVALLLPGWEWPSALGVAGLGLLVVVALMDRARGGS